MKVNNFIDFFVLWSIGVWGVGCFSLILFLEKDKYFLNNRFLLFNEFNDFFVCFV